MKRQIVNIINFLRGCEPREEMNLYESFEEQVRLMEHHDLPGTFLVQYDTLADPRFLSLLQRLDPDRFELGVWYEIVEPLTAAVDLPWRGRYPWDWHVHCGFPLGYTITEREALADEMFRRFREVFGYYPRVFGSWIFDSHTLAYLSDKYGLDAACCCREQYGTDGYTLWGGYYGQGYYPGRDNWFMPAWSEDRQLPVPVFRMLGSDPVYQYDIGLDVNNGAAAWQGVMTLEPVYCGQGGGGDPKWVDWYIKENFNGECLSFGYTQAGQENSFGWPKMRGGITYQFARFAEERNGGRLTVEKLGDTGRWYKDTYSCTPPSLITAHSTFDEKNKRSLWYSSRFYRTNLYVDEGILRIRDLHIFDCALRDPYLDTVCTTNEATYETLPVVDGNLFSGNGIYAGAYPLFRGAGGLIEPEMRDFTCFEGEEGDCVVDFGTMCFTLYEDRMLIRGPEGFVLSCRVGRKDPPHYPTLVAWDEKQVTLRHMGTAYGVRAEKGTFRDPYTLISEDGVIEVVFVSENIPAYS